MAVDPLVSDVEYRRRAHAPALIGKRAMRCGGSDPTALEALQRLDAIGEVIMLAQDVPSHAHPARREMP